MLDAVDAETDCEAVRFESSCSFDFKATEGAADATAMGLAAALCDITADKTRLVDQTEAVLVLPVVLGATTVAVEADEFGPGIAAAGPTTGSATTNLP